MVDIFPSLLRIHCTCRPNTDDDRCEELISFWDMKMTSEQTVSQFGSELLKAMKHYNDASTHDKISKQQLIATLKKGIRKGAQSKRFAAALLTMKYKTKHPEFHTMLLWLDNNCDWSQPLTSPDNPGPAASAVRSRGGGKGGKGAGRGGKGKGGKGRPQKGGKGAEPDGNVTWKSTYYKVEDEDGNSKITKEVPDVRSNRPCFVKFQDGSCEDPDCPYSHEFNLYDRTKSSNAKVVDEQDTKHESSPKSSAVSLDPECDDEFDFTYDLGFQSTSSVSTRAEVLAHDKNGEWFAAEQNELKQINEHGVWTLSTPSTWTLSTPSTLLMFLCLFSGFYLLAEIDIFPLLLTATTLLGDVRPGRLAFALGSSLVSVTIFKKLLRPIISASAAGWPKAAYQIILDCGCTFTMSGDINLFDPRSLTKINETVSLAESGSHAKATPYGKISIGGRMLDALYVPDFKQTMVSMGQLEKMGLRYTAEGSIRKFLSSNNSVFLSFSLTTNNLYTLVTHSSSFSA